MNIPIYRAKKIDSDEWVEGYYIHENPDRNATIVSIEIVACEYMDGYEMNHEYGEVNHVVDPNTLAIHFPNMIDKNGKKIFASLSEDGVGGDDIVTCFSGTNGVAIFDGNKFLFSHDNVEVIGIHKGE